MMIDDDCSTLNNFCSLQISDQMLFTQTHAVSSLISQSQLVSSAASVLLDHSIDLVLHSEIVWRGVGRYAVAVKEEPNGSGLFSDSRTVRVHKFLQLRCLPM